MLNKRLGKRLKYLSLFFGAFSVTFLLVIGLVIPVFNRMPVSEIVSNVKDVVLKPIAAEVNYYFDAGSGAWTSDTLMVDSNPDTSAYCTGNDQLQELTSTSYVSGGSGTITNVEINVKGWCTEGTTTHTINVTPVFGGTDDGDVNPIVISGEGVGNHAW